MNILAWGDWEGEEGGGIVYEGDERNESREEGGAKKR